MRECGRGGSRWPAAVGGCARVRSAGTRPPPGGIFRSLPGGIPGPAALVSRLSAAASHTVADTGGGGRDTRIYTGRGASRGPTPPAR
eukprot:scaffold26572_cov34-Isochrysis_galbana.AAC.1